MTQTTTGPVAHHEVAVGTGHLYDHEGQASFYRINPVKGARVEGVIAVGMAVDYDRDRWGKPCVDAPRPQMWAELSPRINGEEPAWQARREPLRINGKPYDQRFYASVTFLRAEADDDRRRWFPTATVEGVEYLLSDRVEYFAGLTESARAVVRPLLWAVAADYVTAQRWQQALIREAAQKVEKATEEVRRRRAELKEAMRARAVLWGELQTAIAAQNHVDSA